MYMVNELLSTREKEIGSRAEIRQDTVFNAFQGFQLQTFAPEHFGNMGRGLGNELLRLPGE